MKPKPSEFSVKDIVKVWLIKNGYDGLAGDECGCGVDDLAPCMAENCWGCVAGHAEKIDRNNSEYDLCEGEHGDTVIFPGRKPRRKK
jgi:hypothetical protein